MAAFIYKTQFTSRIHDIDAAGVLFFARAFYHAHDAYEALLAHHQQSIADILESNIILPISHSEADFKAPVFLNEAIDIEIYSQVINDSEYSLTYHFIDTRGKVRIKLNTQHVCLDKKTRERTTLPVSLKTILSTEAKYPPD
mgnify:CR=1 FL=1